MQSPTVKGRLSLKRTLQTEDKQDQRQQLADLLKQNSQLKLLLDVQSKLLAVKKQETSLDKLQLSNILEIQKRIHDRRDIQKQIVTSTTTESVKLKDILDTQRKLTSSITGQALGAADLQQNWLKVGAAVGLAAGLVGNYVAKQKMSDQLTFTATAKTTKPIGVKKLPLQAVVKQEEVDNVLEEISAQQEIYLEEIKDVLEDYSHDQAGLDVVDWLRGNMPAAGIAGHNYPLDMHGGLKGDLKPPAEDWKDFAAPGVARTVPGPPQPFQNMAELQKTTPDEQPRRRLGGRRRNIYGHLLPEIGTGLDLREMAEGHASQIGGPPNRIRQAVPADLPPKAREVFARLLMDLTAGGRAFVAGIRSLNPKEILARLKMDFGMARRLLSPALIFEKLGVDAEVLRKVLRGWARKPIKVFDEIANEAGNIFIDRPKAFIKDIFSRLMMDMTAFGLLLKRGFGIPELFGKLAEDAKNGALAKRLLPTRYTRMPTGFVGPPAPDDTHTPGRGRPAFVHNPVADIAAVLGMALKGIGRLFKDIWTGLKNFSFKDLLKGLKEMGGSLKEIGQKGTKAFLAMTTAIAGFGAAAAPVDFGYLTAELTILARAVGHSFIPLIRDAERYITKLRVAVDGLSSEQRASVLHWSKWALGVTGGITALHLLGKAIGGIISTLAVLGPVLMSPWVAIPLAIAAAAGALLYFSGALDTVGTHADDAKTKIAKLEALLAKLKTTKLNIGELKELLPPHAYAELVKAGDNKEEQKKILERTIGHERFVNQMYLGGKVGTEEEQAQRRLQIREAVERGASKEITRRDEAGAILPTSQEKELQKLLKDRGIDNNKLFSSRAGTRFGNIREELMGQGLNRMAATQMAADIMAHLFRQGQHTNFNAAKIPGKESGDAVDALFLRIKTIIKAIDKGMKEGGFLLTEEKEDDKDAPRRFASIPHVGGIADAWRRIQSAAQGDSPELRLRMDMLKRMDMLIKVNEQIRDGSKPFPGLR